MRADEQNIQLDRACVRVKLMFSTDVNKLIINQGDGTKLKTSTNQKRK